MSTKISNLPDLSNRDLINGNEFFPIVDHDNAGNLQTFRISLDTLFLSGEGHEKLTSLSVVQGANQNDNTDENTDDGNDQFTLEYLREDGTTQTVTIQKYKLEPGDIIFDHINASAIVSGDTSTDDIISIGNTTEDEKLVTAAAVDQHVVYKEGLFDTAIKTYFGDSSTARGNSATHVLNEFRLNTEVAQDFTDLLAGVKPELDNFKKIEEQFDTIDYTDKIGTSQVNLNQFRIDDSNNGDADGDGLADFSNRLNIKELAIGPGLIANSAITSNKIAANAVDNSKIADNSIANSNILDNTIIAADKIVDATITPAKLTSGSPQWNSVSVQIENNLNVTQDIVTGRNISQSGTTFSIYNAASRGVGLEHDGRALVHDTGDKLKINHEGDFTGGVSIKGVVKVDDMTLSTISTSGDQAVVTKAYVDRADILLNPIAGDKIQDDVIANNHMADDSVNTPEIVDEAVTSPKIELIGPHWNSSGDVTIANNLYAVGTRIDIGDNGNVRGNTSLVFKPANSSLVAQASINRASGDTGKFSINSGGGDIEFNTRSGGGFSPSTPRLKLTSGSSIFYSAVVIDGNANDTIGGINFNNIPLFIGDTNNGLGIDQNEIVQTGGNLHLGVVETTQDINFTAGTANIVTISGDGDITATGDIITENIKSPAGQTLLLSALAPETPAGKHANIALTETIGAFYNADTHYFRHEGAGLQSSTLVIDTQSKKVSLPVQGTAADHLINKGYVDTKKIAPTDLTDFGPQWDTTTVTIPNDLGVINVATIGDNLSVGGHILLTGTDFKIFNSTRAGTGNTHNGRALVHSGGDKLTINYAGDYTGGVEIKGTIIAPDQTREVINSNPLALATKEYVLSKQAETFPDDNYIRKAGTLNQSMTAALTIAGTVDPGAAVRSACTYVKNGINLILEGSSEGVSGIFFKSEKDGTSINHASDFGFIQYHAHGVNNTSGEKSDLVIGVTNDAAGTVIDNLVIDVPGNKNFVLTPDSGITEHQIWHAGNDGSASGLDADLLDGQHGSYYKNASNLNTGTISDALIPDIITPITSVKTKEIKTSVGQQLILNAGESSGKITGQTHEYVYVNAEQGLSVNTPKISNWNSSGVGGPGGYNETIIKGDQIKIGSNIVYHTGNLTIPSLSGYATESYVNQRIGGGGAIHYYMGSVNQTSSSAAINSATLESGIAHLKGVVSVGDIVIVKGYVTFQDKYWGGNGTYNRDKVDQVIGFWEVLSTTVWRQIARGVGVDHATGSKSTFAYTQLRVTG